MPVPATARMIAAARMIAREDRVRDVLAQTYPAYRITRMRGGFWFATRREPLTAEMKDLGIIRSLGRPNALSLASALSQQHWILHVNRVR